MPEECVMVESGNTLPIAPNPEHGNVRFLASDGSTTILLQSDGKIFIRGEQVDDNRKVYTAMCKFLGVQLGLAPGWED